MPARRALSPALLLSAALLVAGVLALSGCGFIGAARVSRTKPDGFVLRGRVTVPAAADLPDGTTCTAPYPDVAVNARVSVTDPGGHEIAVGYLGTGVIAHGPSGVTCDFPFQIPAVPGGVTRYGIAVGTRAPDLFPARDLREDQTAVISYTS